MKSLSGVRIALAAVAVCLALALSLIIRHGASGAVNSMPSPARPHHAVSNHLAAMPGGEQPAIPPGGFINFEMRYPDEVRETAPAYATEAEVEMARDTNTKINRQITWRETRLWSVELGPHAYGDCKAYALTKRHLLREEGVPDGAFRLAIVYAAKDSGLHMLLEMRLPNDIYVLDSLRNDAQEDFYQVSQMPASYSVVKYQMWGKPARWIAPPALAARATPAMRRLHDEIAAIDAVPCAPRVGAYGNSSATPPGTATGCFGPVRTSSARIAPSAAHKAHAPC